MAKTSKRYTIPGSQRRAMPGARARAAVMPEERIEVSMRIRAKPGQRDPTPAARCRPAPGPAPLCQPRSLRGEHGAPPPNRQGRGLRQSAPAQRRRSRRGPAQRHAGGHGGGDRASLRRRSSAVRARRRNLPRAHRDDQRPGRSGRHRRRRLRPRQPAGGDAALPGPRAPTRRRRDARRGASFTPPQLAALYEFPTGSTAAASASRSSSSAAATKPADIQAYFTGLEAAGADGEGDQRRRRAATTDQRPTAPTARCMLDIEVAAAIAPKATIAVYFAPNTDQGFLDAITTAVHDKVQQAVRDLDQLGRGRVELDARRR